MKIKKYAFLFLTLFVAQGVVTAQDLPKPSPHAVVEQRIGLTDVKVEYSRPGAKERRIWGDLVPFGKIWRAGANQATQFTISDMVVIQGEKLEPGSYALFITPNEERYAQVHFNRNVEAWGTGDYSEEEDVLVVKVELKRSKSMHETMLFYFDNITQGSGDLILSWAGMEIPIPIKVDYIEKSKANIQKAIQEDAENFRVYNNAASFYLDNELNPEMALEYAMQSVELEKKFWNLKTLSEAYAAAGDYDNAVEVAQQSLQMAEEAEYMPYIKMNQENIKKWSGKE